MGVVFKVDPDYLNRFEIHDLCVKAGEPVGCKVHYLIPGSDLEHGLRLLPKDSDDEVMYMCEIHKEWPIDTITLYTKAGVQANNVELPEVDNGELVVVEEDVLTDDDVKLKEDDRHHFYGYDEFVVYNDYGQHAPYHEQTKRNNDRKNKGQ